MSIKEIILIKEIKWTQILCPFYFFAHIITVLVSFSTSFLSVSLHMGVHINMFLREVKSSHYNSEYKKFLNQVLNYSYCSKKMQRTQ